jgi:hypothetical protein
MIISRVTGSRRLPHGPVRAFHLFDHMFEY